MLEYLLGRCALNDQAALERLYDMTSSYLNGVAYRVLGSTDESNDVLQEAFIQIWQNASTYAASKTKPLTWMSSIVRYRAIDKLRSESRHQNRPDHDEDEILNNVASPNSEEDNYLLYRLNEQLRKCLDGMNEKFRKSVELAYLQGFSREELAQVLDANLNTVKSWLRRGSATLKQCMEGQEENSHVE